MKLSVHLARVAILLGTAALAACGGGSPSAPAVVDWLTDPGAAFNLARQKNRPVLVAFVGSDWSVTSQSVKSEIFDTQAFKDFADNNLVLLQIDFSRKGIPAELKQSYDDLAKNVQLNSLPTFLLVEARTNPPSPFGRFSGYWTGGPEVFIQNLANTMNQHLQQIMASQAQPGQIPSTAPSLNGLPASASNSAQQMFRVPQSPSTMSAGVVNPAPLLTPEQLLQQPHNVAAPAPMLTPEQLIQQAQQPAPAQPTDTAQPLFNINQLK